MKRTLQITIAAHEDGVHCGDVCAFLHRYASDAVYCGLFNGRLKTSIAGDSPRRCAECLAARRAQ